MTCVHAAAQLGCLDCVKWMVSYGELKGIPQCIIWNSQAFTDIESIICWIGVSGNSGSKVHCGNVADMPYGVTERNVFRIAIRRRRCISIVPAKEVSNNFMLSTFFHHRRVSTFLYYNEISEFYWVIYFYSQLLESTLFLSINHCSYTNTSAGSIYLRLLGSIWFGGSIFFITIFQYDELR